MKKPENGLDLTALAAQGIPTARGERVLTWHDEFADYSTVEEQWKFRINMNSTDVNLETDRRHLDVKNNQLEMHTYRLDGSDGKLFSIPMALTTYDKMVFRRGYLEMRAKIPYRHGTWPSFWMLTYEPLMESELRSEIDIFEIFSSPDTAVCNLHKSRRDQDGKIIARAQLDKKMVSNKTYTFPHPENLNDEYHVYGMDWTDKDITFLIDDVPYTTISLTKNFTDNPELVPMDCYQDYHYVILCNYVFTEGHHWHPDGYLMKPEDPCPVDYYVDWMRLYQKPGEDILVE